jgi:hypothetical protein
MNGYISAIMQINEKLAAFKEYARKESRKLFHDDSRYQAISYIERKLALHDHMTIGEMEQAIRFIERMKIASNHQKIERFENVLDRDFNYRTLASLSLEGFPESRVVRSQKQEPDVFLGKSTPLCDFLAKVHSDLLGHYELATVHAEGHAPVSKIKYSPDLMRQTQMLHDIESTTKAAATSDHSTSVMDIRRGGTTFYGVKIEAGDNDVYIRPTIESFAGDKIDVPGSKANKIFHFGGQVLHGIILDEFENSMELSDAGRQLTEGLTPNLTRGSVNWSKNPDTGDIYATVELRILACTYIDPTDTSKMPEYYAISSDGITLDTINEDMLLHLNKVARSNQADIVPICTFRAKLDLIRDERTQEHYLKASEFAVKINTPDMVSRKDPDYQPQPVVSMSLY